MIRIVITLVFFLIHLFAFNQMSFEKRMEKYKSEVNLTKKADLLVDIMISSDYLQYTVIQNETIDLLNQGFAKKNEYVINSAKLVYGMLMIRTSQMDGGLKLLYDCVAFFTKTENYRYLAVNTSSRGTAYFKKGMNKEAIEMYHKARKLWLSFGDEENAAQSKYLEANVLIGMQKFKEAEKLLLECIAKIEITKMNRSLSSYYSKLGELYLNQGFKEKAKIYQKKAAEYAYKSGGVSSIARAKNYLAIAEYLDGNEISALKMFYSSLEARKKSSDISLICEGYYNIGMVYQDQKKYDLALSYYDSSKLAAIPHKLYLDQIDALTEMVAIEKIRKNTTKVLLYLDEISDVKSQLNSQKVDEREKDIDLFNSIAAQSKKASFDHREKQLLKELKSKEMTIRTITFGSLILFVVLIFGYFRIRLKNSKSV